MQFPIFKTKIKGITKKFNLNNPEERRKYFELKAGKEIKKLRDYLKKGNTFIVYLLGKKNSGKGTYSKMFAEMVDAEKIEHFSIGDMIRVIDKELQDGKKRKELFSFLEKNYRGARSIKQIEELLNKRSTSAPLLPTELILILLKREIGKRKKKTIFIDGFPRDLDQLNFTLFFRDLIGYRDDQDVFVLLDVPEAVIDERIKHRRVCPACQTSRNLKLLPTSKVGYDEKKKEFSLMCDNPKCSGPKMAPKEGDDKGIKPIKARLMKDEELIKQAASLYGIPKVFLRNSVPKSLAGEYVDDYELTPEYCYQWDGKKVLIKEKNWVIPDDEGRPSYSLLAPPVVVSLFKQLVEILNL
ncbi:MAG: nucleoside monophosphate kinase [Candidatus Nealsonbacteria bacterium]|nr:nucleoside monophosphate kinase [Candidatus Nealsonbacteria bacterium]